MMKIKSKRLGLRLTNKGNVPTDTTEHYFRLMIHCQKRAKYFDISKKKKLSAFDDFEN